MLEIHDLTYAVDNHTILDRISFTIPEHTVTAIVGPNGVGKTTTVQLLSSILPSNNESILSLLKSKKVMYLDLEYLVFDELTTHEFIQLVSSYQRKSPTDVSELLRYFEPLNMTSFLDTRLKGLSLGQKQKLIILLGFLSNADVLIFDEPFNGLDYKSERYFKKLLKENRYRFTIIITTHNFNELDTYTSKCILLKDKQHLIELENTNAHEYKVAIQQHLELEQEL